MKKLWFKAKLYGWGWYPSSWQGWTILAVWIIILINIISLHNKNQSNTFLELYLSMVLMTILLIFICFGTGEKPRWRWGK